MKTIFKFCLAILSLNVAPISVSAQFVQFANGHPMVAKDYADIDGSPYLADQWAKGLAKLADGKTYKDIMLKYNQVDDELYFQGKNQEPLTFVEPVKEFKIDYVSDNQSYEKYFKSGYKGIPGSTESSFFEVLSSGKAELIKRTAKTILESKGYGSSTVLKRFNSEVKYYLIVDGKVTPFKKDKKFILANLPSKQAEVEAYIKTNNINVKDDADLTKLFNYYNSI